MNRGEERFPLRLRLARRVSWSLPPIMGPRIGKALYTRSRAFQKGIQYALPSRTGAIFVGNTGEFHGYNMYISGFNDWRNVAIARALCCPGDTIIEIGANVGTETIGFREVVGLEGRVVAFEPLPSNLTRLHNIIEQNQWNNVSVYPLALDCQIRVAHFLVPPDQNSGVGHLNYATADPPANAVQTKCVTLDSLEPEIGGARLICSDTEGAETAVFEGARAYLLRHRPAIIVEASPKALNQAGSSLSELLSTFSAADYSAFTIGRLKTSPGVNLHQSRTCNWLCLHRTQIACARRCSQLIFWGAVLPFFCGFQPLSQGFRFRRRFGHPGLV